MEPSAVAKSCRYHGKRFPLGIMLSLAAAVNAICPTQAACQQARNVSVGLMGSLSFFDSDYFGLDTGAGLGAVFRYQLISDIHLENKLGIFLSKSGGYDVIGLSGQVGVVSFFHTRFLPSYRPMARLALGLQSVNPVTNTPIDTFRPTQTTFYVIVGGGISRYIWRSLALEIDMDLMLTPYSYLKYSFDRQEVTTDKAQFTHLSVYLGAYYTF